MVFSLEVPLKLLSKKLATILPLPSHVETIPLGERKLYAHLYNPNGEGDWFIMGGHKTTYDYMFYGLQILDDLSVCSFSLNYLESIKLPFGERIRRDRSFKGMTFDELRKNLHLILE
jgi:hypothetical protein